MLFSAPSWFPPAKKVVVKEESAIDVENEANSVWKSILERKGLPLYTPYEYVASKQKDYHESYLDMLFVKARKIKESAEPSFGTKSSSSSSSQTVPSTKLASQTVPSTKSSSASPTVPSTKKPSVVYVAFDDRKREKKRQKSFNAIVYEDPELFNKKSLLTIKSMEANQARYRESLASKQQQQVPDLSSKPKDVMLLTLHPSAKCFFIADSDERFKIGDSVLVRKSPEEGVYVALVRDIHHENNDVKVSVKRYYSPEETIGGRRSFHGNKELVLTNHLQSISAHSVLRKCFVYSVIYYARHKHAAGPYDYFSRFEYLIGSGDFSPDEVDVFCKCLMPFNPDQFMLKCQDCKERYHPACINMTDDEAKQIGSFKCDECRSLDVNQASSSADPDILETLKQQLEEQARAAEKLVKADEELERAAEERQQAAEQARAAEERERAAKERQQAAKEQQRAAQKRIKELEKQVKESDNMMLPQNDEAKQIDSFRCDECRSLDVNQVSADPDMVQPNKRAKW